MNRKITFLFLTLAIGMFFYIRFYDSKQLSTKEIVKQSAYVLPDFAPEHIAKVQIKNIQSDIQLERIKTEVKPTPTPQFNRLINLYAKGEADPQWKIAFPIEDQADATKIESYLKKLIQWKKDSTLLANHQNPEQPFPTDQLILYGLDQPKFTLQLTDDSAPPKQIEIAFGKDAPVEGKCYIQVIGQPGVYAVNNEIRTQLEEPLENFRDPHVIHFSVEDVTHFTIQSAIAKSILVFNKEGEHWQLTKPTHARVSDEFIKDLFGRLEELRIHNFISETTAAPTTQGLTPPVGTMTFTVQNTDAESKTFELTLGNGIEKKPSDEDKVYARIAGRPSVLTVPKSIEDFLYYKPEDTRDHHLTRFNVDMVDRLKISSPSSRKEQLIFDRVIPANPPPARSTDETTPSAWDFTVTPSQSTPAHANQTEVNRLLALLSTQKAHSLVSANPQHLQDYGLDKPSIRVELDSVASENTAESNAGEKPLLTINFGRVKNGLVYAKLENEPYVVALDATILQKIPTDPIAWQSSEIFQIDPNQITKISLRTKGKPTYAFERNPETKAPPKISTIKLPSWRLVEPTASQDQPNVGQLQSLATTLSHLQAIRWVGEEQPEFGFNNPTSVVEFEQTFTGSAKTSTKLIVAKQNVQKSGWYTQIEGKEGVFLLPEPDAAVLLKSPVIGNSKP